MGSWGGEGRVNAPKLAQEIVPPFHPSSSKVDV
jgi:hypothetical protein